MSKLATKKLKSNYKVKELTLESVTLSWLRN
jgi:hypothetical protein